jgi:hypothetical protein
MSDVGDARLDVNNQHEVVPPTNDVAGPKTTGESDDDEVQHEEEVTTKEKLVH